MNPPRILPGDPGPHAALARIAWAEGKSRYTTLFEAYTVDVLIAVRSKGQAEELSGLS